MHRGGFVGRERELAALAGWRDAAAAGSGVIVLVDGEPGMGKTALADELVRGSAGAGWATAWGACLEGDGAPAYWPWIQVLRGLGAPDRFLVEPAGGDDTGSRFRLFDAVIDVLRRSSAKGLLLVLDDLHWADLGSLRLLQVLAAQLQGCRILIVGLFRHADLADTRDAGAVLAAVQRERVARRITLGGLAEAEIAQLAARSMEGAPDASVLDAVQARAEGNPFFALELLRLVRETGALGTVLPTGVRDVVGRRLAAVSAPTRSVLRAAAVLGREFTAAALADVAARPVPDVLGRIDEALAHDLVVSGGHVFRFGHALTQEVCAAELGLLDRQRLHAGAAALLASDEAAIDMRAHHLRQAVPFGSPREALDATLQAAQQARRQLAYEHAAFQLQQALDLLPLLEAGSGQRGQLLLALAQCQFRAGAVADAWTSCRAAAGSGLSTGDAAVVADAAVVVRGVSNTNTDPMCAEIHALCRRGLVLLGDTDPVRRAKLLAQLVITANMFADDVSGLSAQAVLAAEATGDPDARFLALQARQVELVHPRHVLERLTNGEHAVVVGAESGRGDWQAWGLLWRIDAFWELSRRTQLDREVAAFADVVQQLREPLMRWRLTLIRAAVAEIEGRFDEAAALADQAREAGRRGGHETAGFVDLIFRSRLARLTGQGAAEASAAVRRFADSGPPLARVWLALQLEAEGRDGEAAAIVAALTPQQVDEFPRLAPEWMPARTGMATLCSRFGSPALASALYADLLPFADRQVVAGAFSGSDGPVSRYLGMLALQLGDLDAAQAHLGAALESAAAMAAPPYEALARLELARLCLQRNAPGDPATAQEHLRSASATARRLGMAPLQARVAALAAAHPPLSSREDELARLIADGLSNRQIAANLHLSERTVESHVRNILTKLGLDRRTQIVSWALHRD